MSGPELYQHGCLVFRHILDCFSEACDAERGSARHIIDMVHKQYRTLKKKHKRGRITIRWTPGHSDVTGNEKADEQAKRAAKGESSPPEELPACLRKPLPISKAAMRRSFKKKLTATADNCWKESPRYRKLARIDLVRLILLPLLPPGCPSKSKPPLLSSPPSPGPSPIPIPPLLLQTPRVAPRFPPSFF